jgi:hypothetical protein
MDKWLRIATLAVALPAFRAAGGSPQATLAIKDFVAMPITGHADVCVSKSQFSR